MRDIYQTVTDRILAELQAGAAPWIKPWSATPGLNQPHNAATGRPYSGANVVLLWMTQASNGWATPRFLTFKQCQELGGNVRKGEHGTLVIFVKRLTVADRQAPEGSDETKQISMMRGYTVFNVDQCENLPAKITAPAGAKLRHSEERDATIDEFLAATGANIVEGHGEAFFRPGADQISMPAFAAFKGAGHFYATVFHELGHWTGHKPRLDRDLKNRFGSRAYAAEELVAELCAAFLCAEFSIDGELRHAGYIENWIELLKDDPRAFISAASKAQAAADYLRDLALAAPVAVAA